MFSKLLVHTNMKLCLIPGPCEHPEVHQDILHDYQVYQRKFVRVILKLSVGLTAICAPVMKIHDIYLKSCHKVQLKDICRRDSRVTYRLTPSCDIPRLILMYPAAESKTKVL